jgi:hypothetical protein
VDTPQLLINMDSKTFGSLKAYMTLTNQLVTNASKEQLNRRLLVSPPW